MGGPAILHIDTLSHWLKAIYGKMHGSVHSLRSTEVLSHGHTQQATHTHRCKHTGVYTHT